MRVIPDFGCRIVFEILEGALDEAHITCQIMPQMPWRRARYEAIKEPSKACGENGPARRSRNVPFVSAL